MLNKKQLKIDYHADVKHVYVLTVKLYDLLIDFLFRSQTNNLILYNVMKDRDYINNLSQK